MVDTNVTIVGNVARIELKYLASGASICDLGIAVNERQKNKHTGEWEDAPASFYDCTVFGQLAENVAESVEKGNRVIVTGKLKQDQWETDDGQKRSKVKVLVDAIGPELRFATAVIQKITRENASEHRQGQSSSSAPPAASDAPDYL